ncbi:pyridoxal phosphate-dependent aminotransferase [Halovivax cerinus]|uniref:Aminotransferase n=1 Tax=Halovivax cerinus TaxID=1487865 RepID=A0ABD5NP22_9EURY|nr:pyridoxal phosphate-dependent aminotransferase [Halovivax cerinus]
MSETDRLAARARGAEGSEIRVMFERARAYDGDLARLEIGEPDFDTPGYVVDAAAEGARGGATHYTSTYGTTPLREGIADRIERENGVPVDADGVLVTAGGIEAITVGLLSVAGPGDEVVVLTPGFANYTAQVELTGAEPVQVSLPPETGFDLDPDLVAEHVTDDTAAVVLCRPTNPTGRVYDEADVRAVARVAADHDAYVLADEVYERLTYEGTRRSVAAIADDPEWVLSVNSFSKGHAMTGWRVGWLAGPSDVIDAAQVIRQTTTLCPSSVSQEAALAALEGPQEPFEEMVAAYEDRRDTVLERVREWPEITCADPEGAFYAFLDVRAFDEPAMDLALRLLSDYGVSTTPGTAFGPGGEGHLRISYATDEAVLETGLDRLERAIRDEFE